MFIHRYLLEYFASMSTDPSERVVPDSAKSPYASGRG